MTDRLIFIPCLAQMLLTLYAYVALGRAKQRAVNAGVVNAARRALYDDAWPAEVLQINNNIRNQFQLPVLFYALILLLWVLNAAGVFAQIVAWLFVVSRIVHLHIHIGSNQVPWRRRAFSVGVVMVALLWGMAVVAIFAPARS